MLHRYPRFAALFALVLVAATLLDVHAQNGLWVRKTDLPGAARTRGSGFTIGGAFYVGLGAGTPTGDTSDFRAFDAVTSTWTQVAGMSMSRSMATAFAIGGTGYVFGGHDGTNTRKDLWAYDPVADAWTQRANLPGQSRDMAMSFTLGGKAYVGMGGHVGSLGFSALNDLWEYDPATNSWTAKAAFPLPGRWNGIGFSIGDKGYFGTGMDIQGTRHNDLWEYDPATNTWTQRASMGGAPRTGASAFTIDGKGYVGMGAVGLTFLKDLWAYDPISDTWEQEADLQGATRSWAVGGSVAGIGLVCTGSLTYELDDTHTTELWAYHPDPSVICSLSSDTLCADNSAFDVDCAIGTVFNAGNVFTAQLSDANGGFAAPLPIGSMVGTTSGTLSASVPLGTPAGSGYRIRIVSSDPVTIGPENAGPINIAAYQPWYFDADGDGRGDPAISQMACAQPAGYVLAQDCDDTDPLVFPGASCDDGDAGTVNDAITAECVCLGIGCSPSQLTSSADPVISCGAVDLKLNGTSTIAATEVSGASKYQFRFTNIPGQPAYARNIAFPVRSFTLTKWSTNPLKAGRTYNVIVRVSFDNGVSWCDWGPSCTVKVSSTPMAPGMTRENELAGVSVPELLLYPNPNNGEQVRIAITGVDGDQDVVSVDLLDLRGRVLISKVLRTGNGVNDQVLDLGQDIPSGIYLVKVSAGGFSTVERLIVQR